MLIASIGFDGVGFFNRDCTILKGRKISKVDKCKRL